MKTNLEWLHEMDEPERSQAIENCKNDEPYTGDYLSISLEEALYQSFYWNRNNQGFTYWMNIKDKYATDGKH